MNHYKIIGSVSGSLTEEHLFRALRWPGWYRDVVFIPTFISPDRGLIRGYNFYTDHNSFIGDSWSQGSQWELVELDQDKQAMLHEFLVQKVPSYLNYLVKIEVADYFGGEV